MNDSVLNIPEDRLNHFIRKGDYDIAKQLTAAIELCNPNEEFTFLDVGCGDGFLGDYILNNFPKAKAVLLDISPKMLQLNKPNPRKENILGSALEMSKIDGFKNKKFDFIIVSMLMHHYVTNSYENNHSILKKFLLQLKQFSHENTKIIVLEQIYDGILFNNLPGRIIYFLTQISNPFFATIIKKLGANLAGVGVSFASNRTWRKRFQDLNIKIAHTKMISQDGSHGFLKQLILHIKTSYQQIYILEF